MRYSIEDAREIARRAAMVAGADEASARSLANATVAAETHDRGAVGFAHLLDYLAAFAAGRIAVARPEVSFPTPVIIRIEARGAIAQLGFDLAFDEILDRTNLYGLTVFAQAGSYTTGELGYYVRRLADAGLVALAASNGPALMSVDQGGGPVYGANPLAFAAPVAGGAPLVIDQSSSATAFVNVRRAAERGEPIPQGWALDRHGQPTTDARAAIEGTLLGFGGARGANIALMVEVLAAGLTGANWSLDAPPFASGERSPGAGLFITTLKPDALAPDFAARLAAHLARLADGGVYIPGQRDLVEQIELSDAVLFALGAYA